MKSRYILLVLILLIIIIGFIIFYNKSNSNYFLKNNILDNNLSVEEINALNATLNDEYKAEATIKKLLINLEMFHLL
ncbi:MAG: hypothetical protein PHX47_01320 [Candidatus ainarchaeum sp.]|nr:hypothetical protein [Candidatus ainarchaeum sp.]